MRHLTLHRLCERSVFMKRVHILDALRVFLCLIAGSQITNAFIPKGEV